MRQIAAGALMALLLSACTAPPSVPTPPPEDGVYEHVLNNGLKLIIKEDHRAPVVVSQIWYKVGSSYEHGGITGVSHVLEHMMFKGTDKLGPGDFSRLIAREGGRENAFTSRDYTAYFQRLEKSRLPIALELEADRMQNLLLRQEDFAQERKVVMEERRLRTEDNPGALTYERFIATAFQVSPIRNPVIGWMNDLQHLQLSDLERWYQSWYAPNNATLVIVGDVDPAQVRADVERFFGPIPARDIPELRPRTEPEQKGIKRLVVKAPARVPSLMLGYKTPVFKQVAEPWEVYALEMLVGILDGGNSARLSRDLVRGQQIASSAGAGYDLFARLPGLLTLSGTPANGHGVAELEQALRAQVHKLRTTRVSQFELDRVLAQVQAAKVYERDSVFYQAMQMGMLETVGLDWRELDRYLEGIRAVTPEQIQQVAQKYLVDERLTVATLEPQQPTR